MGEHRQGQPQSWKLRGQIPHDTHPRVLECFKRCKYLQRSNCSIFDSSSRAEKEQGGNWQSAMQYHEKALENLGEQGSCTALRSLEFQSIHGALGLGSAKQRPN